MTARFKVRLPALAPIFLSVVFVPWAPADAGVRICASETLTQRDQRQLYKVARSAVPDGELVQESLSVCLNRGAADASLETPRRVVSEGAYEWWLLRCKRGWRAWTCESPSMHRSATMVLAVEGQERRMQLWIDGNTSFTAAKELTSRAWAIYADTHSVPSPCWRSSNSESDDRLWARMRDSYKLDSTITELNVSVSSDGNVTEVQMFDGSGLGFTFRLDIDERSPGAVCWSEWIIVT
jgi:hypothetical protein